MKKMRRILALACAMNMLFGNLSLDSFTAVASEIPAAEKQVSHEGEQSAHTQEAVIAEVAPAPPAEEVKPEAPNQESPQGTGQNADVPKTEVIANPVDVIADRPTEAIMVGEKKQIALSTVLTLHVSQAQAIFVLVDAPVTLKIANVGDYPSANGRVEVSFNANPGDYELTFSGDSGIGSIMVEVTDVQSYLNQQVKPIGKASKPETEKTTEEQLASVPASEVQDTAPGAVEEQKITDADEHQVEHTVELLDEEDDEPVVHVEMSSKSTDSQDSSPEDRSAGPESENEEEKTEVGNANTEIQVTTDENNNEDGGNTEVPTQDEDEESEKQEETDAVTETSTDSQIQNEDESEEETEEAETNKEENQQVDQEEVKETEKAETAGATAAEDEAGEKKEDKVEETAEKAETAETVAEEDRTEGKDTVTDEEKSEEDETAVKGEQSEDKEDDSEETKSEETGAAEENELTDKENSKEEEKTEETDTAADKDESAEKEEVKEEKTVAETEDTDIVPEEEKEVTRA